MQCNIEELSRVTRTQVPQARNQQSCKACQVRLGAVRVRLAEMQEFQGKPDFLKRVMEAIKQPTHKCADNADLAKAQKEDDFLLKFVGFICWIMMFAAVYFATVNFLNHKPSN